MGQVGDFNIQDVPNLGILDKKKKIRFGIKVFWFRDVLSKFSGNQATRGTRKHDGGLEKHVGCDRNR